jgi:hypothetical protein
MRVHHRARVGPVAIHLEVHLQLGRRIALAADLFSFEIRDHHHVGGHESLRHVLRSGDQPVVVKPYADIAVVGGDVSALPQPASDFDDVRSRLFFSFIAIDTQRGISRCRNKSASRR